MTDQKITQLTSASVISSTDLFLVTVNPATLPNSLSTSASTFLNSFSGSTATANLIVKGNSASKIDNGWLKTGSGNGIDADTIDTFHASQTPIQGQIPVLSSGSGITIGGNIISANDNGWIPANETWTYTTASKVLIPVDVTTKYQKGDKIKLTNTTDKYFFVFATPTYSGSNTTLPIFGGSDYAVVSASIVNPYYSKVDSPFGFPGFFNYTATPTGFSSNPTLISYFSVRGPVCNTVIATANDGVSSTNFFTISAPITAATVTSMSWRAIAGYNRDNGAVYTPQALALILSSGSAFTIYKDNSGAVWTTSGSKGVGFDINYRY